MARFLLSLVYGRIVIPTTGESPQPLAATAFNSEAGEGMSLIVMKLELPQLGWGWLDFHSLTD